MQTHPKQNRRLYLSVIIKLLTLLGLLLISVVFINSLFTDDRVKAVITKDEIPSAMIELSGMHKGQIRKTRWNNKEVAVLLRQFPEKLKQSEINYKQHDLHDSIASQNRSKKVQYFVYYNVGDSKTCPLYYAVGLFKDVCSSTQYDESGRALNYSSQAFEIEIPPHYFKDNKVIFGKWMP